jgi:hypothetical protein
LWSSLKKFYGRHHELVNDYRVSVTQIRTDLHLLLMSFPSSDGTYSYSLSIDITEEGSDVGDDSDDGDFEPSLNFTLILGRTDGQR